MKKATSKLLSLILGAALAVTSLVGIAACGETGNTGDTGDPNIRLVYDMYVENCAAKGEEALTYEDWLASIKGEDGEDGKDGVTPHIDDETGYWFIGDKNTGIKAAGSNGTNGVTPHIGENGNWFIGDEDSHVPATGAKGDDGDDGTNGTSFLHGKGKPDAALGSAGDLYLDLETYDLYEKTAEGWSTDPVGNIKGAKGDKGDKGDSAAGSETVEPMPSGTVIKEYKGVAINANDSYQLDLTAVESGYYWIVADTQTTAAAGVLSAESTISYTQGTRTATATAPYDLYSSKYKGFRAIVSVDTDVSKQKVTVYNNSEESITTDLKLVEYTPETLAVGQEYEVPCLPASMTGGTAGRVPVHFDSSLLGKEVKITLVYAPETLEKPCLRYISAAGSRPSNIDQDSWPDSDYQTNVWSHTFTIPSNALELFLLTTSSSVKKGFNAVVKIEEVS